MNLIMNCQRRLNKYHLLQLFPQSIVSDFQITKLPVRLNYSQQILQELILGFSYLVLRKQLLKVRRLS